MDQTVILRHFDEARRHIAQGQRCLARQRALIEKLRRDGHSTSSAQALLQRLEESQALHRDTLKRVQEELDLCRRLSPAPRSH